MTNAPPFIVAQPQSQSIILGGNASFTVTAAGTPPLSYQWRLQGTNLPGATGTTHPVLSAELADAGDYSVVVSNPVGSLTSSIATRSVIVMPGVSPVTGSPYLENFDTMVATGTVTPYGWYVGPGVGADSGTNVVAGDGSSNNGDNYNFGTTGSGDRVLGSLVTSSIIRNTEARFINIFGSTSRR